MICDQSSRIVALRGNYEVDVSPQGIRAGGFESTREEQVTGVIALLRVL